jgi:hypothetical protein
MLLGGGTVLPSLTISPSVLRQGPPEATVTANLACTQHDKNEADNPAAVAHPKPTARHQALS